MLKRAAPVCLLALASCFVYGEDLLEDDDATTASSSTGTGGAGGTATSTSTTSTSATSTSATSSTTTSATTTTTTTTSGMTAADVWINEIHYDNDGVDTGEGIEVAGPAGTDLTSYSLELYNGSSGAVYDSVTLSGVIPDQQAGYGTVWFPIAGIQNGDPDGVALVFGGTQVLQFLSYDGVLTAASGPAAGMMSIDIGVSQSSSPAGESLQLTGTGNTYAAFSWSATTLLATPNLPNEGQTFQ